MNLDEATRKRIKEILVEKNLTLTNLCLISNLTPSTIFDFMYKRTKSPKSITIKKICTGAGITLKDFYDRDYFNDNEEVY